MWQEKSLYYIPADYKSAGTIKQSFILPILFATIWSTGVNTQNICEITILYLYMFSNPELTCGINKTKIQ